MKTIELAVVYRDNIFLQGRLLLFLRLNSVMIKVKQVYTSKEEEEEEEQEERIHKKMLVTLP